MSPRFGCVVKRFKRMKFPEDGSTFLDEHKFLTENWITNVVKRNDVVSARILIEAGASIGGLLAAPEIKYCICKSL